MELNTFDDGYHSFVWHEQEIPYAKELLKLIEPIYRKWNSEDPVGFDRAGCVLVELHKQLQIQINYENKCPHPCAKCGKSFALTDFDIECGMQECFDCYRTTKYGTAETPD